MMTRRDVLNQLKRVGIHQLSLLKRDCREFETYMDVYYDYKILKKERGPKIPALSLQNPASTHLKISLNLKRYLQDYSGLSFNPPRGNKSGQKAGQ
jgi:hypothetical protein